MKDFSQLINESIEMMEHGSSYLISGSRVQPCASHRFAPSNAFCVYTRSRKLKMCFVTPRTIEDRTHTHKEVLLSQYLTSLLLSRYLVTRSASYSSTLLPDVFPTSSTSCTSFGPIFVSLLRDLLNHLVSC